MKIKYAFPALCAILPTLAFAHAGSDAAIHHHAFLAGLTHPFTGLDHLAAMLAVGMWSALAFRNSAGRVLAAPLAFVALLLVGALLALAGLQAPGVEPMIAASLLVLGVMVSAQLKLQSAAGMALVGMFASFHGLAHGSELSAQHAAAALSGMVLGTALLHAAGILLGRFALDRHVWASRIAGGSVALLGAGLLAGAV